jgi:hypothetical protein
MPGAAIEVHSSRNSKAVDEAVPLPDCAWYRHMADSGVGHLHTNQGFTIR